PMPRQTVDTLFIFFFQGEDGIRDFHVTGVQTCALPISVVMDMLLKACLDCGVRLARPGEFSERAFLNDKLDLAQAEAIADLIEASSEQAARNAVQSLQGAFSQRVHSLT